MAASRFSRFKGALSLGALGLWSLGLSVGLASGQADPAGPAISAGVAEEAGAGGGGDTFAAARRRMVEEQIRDRGILQSGVLAAMESVPRHLFVPAEERAQAYDDQPLPIGH